jgi:hypothetical protein
LAPISLEKITYYFMNLAVENLSAGGVRDKIEREIPDVSPTASN